MFVETILLPVTKCNYAKNNEHLNVSTPEIRDLH